MNRNADTLTARINATVDALAALVDSTDQYLDVDDEYRLMDDMYPLLPWHDTEHMIMLDTFAMRDLYRALQARIGGSSTDQAVISLHNRWWEADGRKATDMNGNRRGVAWIFGLVNAARSRAAEAARQRAYLATLPSYACEFTTAADAYYDANGF